MSRVKLMVSPAVMPSARRTAALSGRMYTPPERLSGKMDVSHTVFPTRTSTRTAPNPLRGPVYFLRISSECFLSTYAKCHAPCAPGQSVTSERSLYSFAIQTRAHPFYTTGWVQCEQRLAPAGISLKHSAHFLVVGSAGGPLRDLPTRMFIGFTPKKKMDEGIIKNEMMG